MADNRGSGATTFEEGARLVRESADALLARDRAKHAAAKINPGADKFTQSAANPQWLGGFDEKLGIQRASK